MCGRKLEALLIALAALLPGQARAQQSTTQTRTPQGTERSYYVPFERIEEVLGSMERGVLLPYQELARLWGDRYPLSPLPDEPAPPRAVIRGGEMRGGILGGEARVELTLLVESLAEGPARIPLGLPEAALVGLAPRNARAWVLPSAEGGYELLLLDKGTIELQLSLLIPVRVQASGATVAFTPPPASSLRLELALPAAATLVGVEGARASSVLVEGLAPTLRAFLSAGEQTRIAYRERLPLLDDTTGSLTSTATVRVDIGLASLRALTTLAGSLHGAAVEELDLSLPPDSTITAVDAPHLLSYEVMDGDPRRLRIAFDDPVTGEFTISVGLESTLRLRPGETSSVEVPTLSLLRARRETGTVVVRVQADLDAKVQEARGLVRVDPAGLEGAPATLAYRYLERDHRLSLGVTPRTPRVTADIFTLYTISESDVHLDARIDLGVREASLFELIVAVPRGASLVSPPEDPVREVLSTTDESGTRLRLLFARGLLGTTRLSLRLRLAPIEGDDIGLDPVTPLSVESLRGEVAVAATSDIEISAMGTSLLTPVDLTTIQGKISPLHPESSLRLTFLRREPGFTLSVHREKKTPLVTCTTSIRLAFSAERLDVDQTMSFTMEHAFVDRLTLLVPGDLDPFARIEGESVREIVKEGPIDSPGPLPRGAFLPVRYTVQLERKLPRRSVRLRASMPLAPGKGGAPRELFFEPAQPLYVERETGFIACTRDSELEIDILPATAAVEPIDVRELPPETRLGASLAFRFRERPARIHARVVHHEPEPVLPAIVGLAHLETVVARSGRARTLCALEIRRSELPSLEVEVMRGARLLSARTADAALHPLRREGSDRITLPLPATSQDLSVFLLYDEETGLGSATKTTGSLRLAALRLYEPHSGKDLPILRQSWSVWMPEESRLVSVGGNMQSVPDVPHWSSGPWVPSLLSGFTSSPGSQGVPGRLAIEAEATRLLSRGSGEVAGVVAIDLVREGTKHSFYRMEGGAELSLSYVSRAVHGFLRLLFLILPLLVLIPVDRRLRRRRTLLVVGSILLLIAAAPFLARETHDFLDASLVSVVALGVLWSVGDLARRISARGKRTDSPPPSPPPPDSPAPPPPPLPSPASAEQSKVEQEAPAPPPGPQKKPAARKTARKGPPGTARKPASRPEAAPKGKTSATPSGGKKTGKKTGKKKGAR